MSGKTSFPDTAVIVASHDGSKDLWEPLLTLFQRNWPDCPFPIYLVCNAAEYRTQGVTRIAVGPDRSWSDTLSAALKQIPEKYILLWIDDHFLSLPVQADRIVAAVKAFELIDGNYLRLQSLPKPDAPYNEHFGVVQKGAIYRTSTIASVWKTKILEQLLKPGQSAWEFETAGARRSDDIDGFFSVWQDCFRIENLLIKGKILPSSRRRIERSLGQPLTITRPVMSVSQAAIFSFRNVCNRILVSMPHGLSKTLRATVYGKNTR